MNSTIRTGRYFALGICAVQNIIVLLLAIVAWQALFVLPFTILLFWVLQRRVPLNVEFQDRDLLLYSFLGRLRGQPHRIEAAKRSELVPFLERRAQNQDFRATSVDQRWVFSMSADCARSILKDLDRPLRD